MMERAVVDLAGCTGTEQPYVMVSRCTSVDGLVILRDFEFGQITKRRSEDLRKEMSRIECLRLQTIAKYGLEIERREARMLLDGLKNNCGARKRKGTGDDIGQSKRCRVGSN